MYNIIFYRNAKGEESVKEYLIQLQKESAKNKESRIKLQKIYEYIEILKRCGTLAGEKYVKHIIDDIWELRPLRDRILFFCWKDGKIVLLHTFVKKTNKTPKREIIRAIGNQHDFLKRSELDE